MQKKTMDFVGQHYWDESYEKYSYSKTPANDPIRLLLLKYLNPDKKTSVLELGCFPGRYLQVFGELGYAINGIDTTPRVKEDLPDYLKKCGFNTGVFIQGDALSHGFEKQYGVVCSFGFIEHFEEWDLVIKRHASLLENKGLLILTVPNFRGFFQYFYHLVFDKPNLKRHNIASMNPSKWINTLEKEGLNCDVLFSGPFGKIDFWVDATPNSGIKRFLLKKLNALILRLAQINLKSRNAYSPYLGLIVKIER